MRSTRAAASSPRKKAPAHSTTLSSQNPPYRPTRHKTTLECSPSPGHSHNLGGYLRSGRCRRAPDGKAGVGPRGAPVTMGK